LPVVPSVVITAFNGSLPPPNWNKPVYDLDPGNPSNNGYQNEDLIVWMRTAAFPSFRKFYRRVNQTGTFSQGLPAGNYTLLVAYGECRFHSTKYSVYLRQS
jgi:LEM3 (ligand-effect modulator 3) family / CDC50 family